MKPHKRWIFVLAGMLVVMNCQAEQRYASLRTNPFAVPADMSATVQNKRAVSNDAVEMELRATMVAGPDSQANIGGTIVGLGDQVNGYRLAEVHVRHVVLERDGASKEIRIDDNDGT